jgi:general secretion pathway protein K
MHCNAKEVGQEQRQPKPVLHTGRSRQLGAALLAAMLTVTLVATFAASAMWQQWRAVEVEAAERTRSQSAWILVGALDWARLILREDARSGGADHLAEPWAVPLQESRLTSFLAADKTNTTQANAGVGTTPNSAAGNAASSDNNAYSEAGNEVFLSGQIVDMQSLLNINNLVANGTVSVPDLRAFAKLFDLLDLEPRELLRATSALMRGNDQSTDNAQASFAPLLPQRFEQLVWLGFSKDTLERLRPYVGVLPARTPVNINTASAEVLYASIPSLALDGARKLIAQRDKAHFRDLNAGGALPAAATAELNEGRHSVATRYFEVRGRIRLGIEKADAEQKSQDVTIQERSLVQRDGIDVKVLWRERAALGSFAPEGGAVPTITN